MLVDEMFDILVEICADPSRCRCIELESFFLFVFYCPYFDLLAGKRAVYFVGGGLLDRS